MPHPTSPRFPKTLLALAASALLAPHGAWALDLVQSPPGTVEPYVRPNVIVSIDDSGSMDWQITSTNTGLASITTPNADGTWDPRAKRINILKYALTQVFSDTSLLPDKKIRLSWQAMWNNGGSPNAKSVDSTSMNQNSMRVLQGTQRTNFLTFVSKLSPNNGTPSHQLFSQADHYMREPLGTNSAWASDPGTTGAPYLACRRSYHIFFSDGRWNGSILTSGAQDDNTKNKTLPDGMVYGSTSAATRPYNQLYSDADSNTLADWAFYSWSTPPSSASSMTGTMQPASDYRKAPATETFGTDSAGKPATLDRYWNPRYDPATWPHMVTYTIGISTDATTWPYDKYGHLITPVLKAPTQQVPFGYDNDFLNLVTGQKTWPRMTDYQDSQNNNHGLDLWHAALNGRGRFYAVMKGDDLEKAFREIVGQINTATDPDLTSSATSGTNPTPYSNVGKYTAAYSPLDDWKGFVTADKVQADGTTIPDPGWGGLNTADKLDALPGVTNRLVLSWSDTWNGTQYQGGVPFQWATDESYLSTAQKLWLQTNVGGTNEGATAGQQRLNYIRGDRTLEGSDSTGYTTALPYRARKSREGDIINSDVWYTGAPAGNSLLKGYAAFVRDNKSRPAMLYVGGNDGMLHGFAAADGQEKIAYVPRGTIPSLTLLTDPQYNNKHQFFVDGSPMTGDVDMGVGAQDPSDPNNATYNPNWRTLLVGSLGLGGKGYFVLDVTNPTANPLANGTPGFAQGNAQQLVMLDRTRGTLEPVPNCAAMTEPQKTACTNTVTEDKDIGYITAKPVRDDSNAMLSTQITRMNDNRWAVVMGNGYNSSNQRPVLLVQYLDGAKELLRIPVTSDAPGTGNALDNGLAAPRLVDLNGDGRADIVYAGDNLGNLWKFDLTSNDATQWKVAFSGSPLFTARGPAALGGTTRPKTQPISVVPSVRANDRTKLVGTGTNIKTVRVGGMMVAFGTGRNVDKTDPSNVDVQTLYSVLDNTSYKPVGTHLQVHPGGGTCPSGSDCIPAPAALGTGVVAAKLAQQTFTVVSGDYSTVDVVDNLKQDTWANFNGWYLDLPAVGERLLKPMGFYDASNLLTVWSQVPAKGSNVDPNVESCDSSSVDAERQYRTFVNIMDGKAPTVQIVDMNSDGLYTAAGDKGVSRAAVSKGPHTIVKKSKFENADIDAKNNKENLADMPEEALRPSWRQLK